MRRAPAPMPPWAGDHGLERRRAGGHLAPLESWIEFDSLINVRPAQGNRSRDVEDETVRQAIRQVVASLVSDG